MPKKDPREIKEVIENLIEKNGMVHKMEASRALLYWDNTVGNLAARTKAVGIGHGKLYVNVTDSMVLHQLTLYKNRLMDKINLLMGKRVVRDIVFRVGSVERDKNKVENRDDYIKKINEIQLNQEKKEKIEQTVSQIHDEELKETLKDIFTSQSKLSKFRDSENNN
ncbi:DUF721 domain-containing protein [Candidatus Poribacteria bacterium]|nr:DUF721 domain-containing protein [Candidatus Poribacteria bacterium]